MAVNKNHWYDGWFYDRVIAPNQDRLFGEIKELITKDASVIDIGCGTGRLAFTLADKCCEVLGIDLSSTNIERANLNLKTKPTEKISFLHSDLTELSNEKAVHYNYAVLTYVIHEVDKIERINLLKEAANIADKIIIGDYLFPRQKGLGGFLSRVIEFIAGRDHYRNYKSYMADGGTRYLAEKAGLKILYEKSFLSFNNHIIILAYN